MPSTDEIRTLTIRMLSDGMPQVVADINAVGKAQSDLTVVSDTSSRAQTSVKNALESAQRQLDLNYRTSQQFNKIQLDITRAHNDGLISIDRYNQLSALNAERFNQGGIAAKAFAAATSGVSGQLIALSAGAGPVGTFLAAIPGWGLPAAAALGLAAAAFHYVAEESARMGEKAIGVRAFTEVTGLAAAQFAAVRNEGASLGIASDLVATKFEKLTAGLHEARKAAGTLYDDVRSVNGGLAEELNKSTTTAQGIDVLAKAYQQAGDQAAKAALATAIFGGRGGAQFGPILGAIADAGGLDNLTKATKGLSEATDDQVRRWATMKAQIDETEKRAKNILASIFTSEGLQVQLAAAQAMERFAQAAKDAASQKEGLSFFQSILNKMAAGGDADFSIAASANKVSDADLAKQAAAVREALASWKQYDDALAKVANDNGTVQSQIASTTKSLAEQRNEATSAANVQATRVGALGSAATIDEHAQQRLLKIEADRLNNLFSLNKAENDGLAARAKWVTLADANMQKETLRLGQLGELASVTELNRQKEDALQKSIRDGARFTDTELAAIRERNKLLTESSKIENQMVFDRQQIFKTQVDQSVDALLRANGIPPASARAEAIRDYMQMTDALKQMSDLGGTALSTFVKGFAETRDAAKAAEDAAKGLLSTIVDAAAKRVVTIGINAAFGDTAGMATGATTAAGILTAAGADVAASFVDGATTAAGILGATGAEDAGEIAISGATAGASLAAGGAAAGTALWGPIAILGAAAAALGALSFFGNKSEDPLEKAKADWAEMTEVICDFVQVASAIVATAEQPKSRSSANDNEQQEKRDERRQRRPAA